MEDLDINSFYQYLLKGLMPCIILVFYQFLTAPDPVRISFPERMIPFIP